MKIQRIRQASKGLRSRASTPARGQSLVVRWLACLVVLGLGASPAVGQDGDTSLFSTSFPPNVLLFVDNSGSMRTIMYHPAFDIEVYEAGGVSCDIITSAHSGDPTLIDENNEELRASVGSNADNSEARVGEDEDDGFVSTSGTGHARNGYINRTFCGQTRRLYVDGSVAEDGDDTWWTEPYLEWYFNLDPSDTVTWGPANQTAAEILAEIEDSANGRTYIDGSTFGKFQRARISAARDIASDVIYQTNTDCPAYGGDCGVYYDRVRFGLAQFQQNARGGFVRVGIDAYAENKSRLESSIDDIDAGGWTPLGETLFKLYTYFMHRLDASQRPVGKDGITRFPHYHYRDTNGSWSHTWNVLGGVPEDPVQEACQQNFIIMI
ncbi:MAG: hypothetical protein HRU02_04150, partial [Myxococcales bacterium]|nr:hypothetical protein [Myxococcales bacterium]